MSQDFMNGFLFGGFLVAGITLLSIYLIPYNCPSLT